MSNHSEYRPQACVKQTPVMPHEQGSHVHCTKVKSTKVNDFHVHIHHNVQTSSSACTCDYSEFLGNER